VILKIGTPIGKFFGAAVLIAACLVSAARVQAQAEMKTLAVLSVASIENILNNVEYLTEVGSAGDLGRMAKMFAVPYTQGLDNKKPIGFVLQSDGQEFVPLGFIPVKDLKATLALLSENLGAPRDVGDGIQEIPSPAQPIFVKEQSGWAFIGQTVESLKALPQNPLDQLGKLPTEYDVAIRATVKNIPAQYREMAITTLKEGIQQGLAQRPDEDDATYNARKQLVQAQIEQIDKFINESDQLTVGWKVDPAGKRTYLDFAFTAIPGTEMAQQLALMGESKTDFAGFFSQDAAMSFNSAAKISAEQIEQSAAMLDNLRETAMKEIAKKEDMNANARQAATEMLSAVMNIFIDTMKTGQMDMGASLMLQPKAMTFVSGFHVADGQAVDKLVRRIDELAKGERDFPGIKFNAAQQAGVAFHTMSVPIPADEDARKILGETLDLAVGIGKSSAYFAVGKDCVAKLQEMITASASQPQKSIPPFQVVLAATHIMEFVSSIEANPIITSILEGLKESDGKDHFLIHGLPVENGLIYRLELEEGIIKAAGRAAQMANAGGF
jgi:hypothetical protein